MIIERISVGTAMPIALIAILLLVAMATTLWAQEEPSTNDYAVYYRSINVDGVEVAYREAGDPTNPTVLLLHGYPTSSHMFRNLIPELASDYHVIAPDYPGYGASAMPARTYYEYSFANIAETMNQFLDLKGVDTYSAYLMDFGAPIGFRLFAMHPERVTGLILQNANAYDEGIAHDMWDGSRALWADPTEERREAIRGAFTLPAVRWQYTHGVSDVSRISPDNWFIDHYLLSRPGNQDIQLDMFVSYGTNVPLYPEWQALFREHQPPTLIVWGRNDQIFPEAGAHPYLRDLENVEFHLYDTGHFALEEFGDDIAEEMLDFLAREVAN